MDLVRLVNTGHRPVEFNGNERFVIAPDTSRIVRWEVARNWLGNPDIRDTAERAAAYKLVRLNWGYADGMHSEAEWEENIKPTIRVETIDDSPEQVFMLIDDPLGEKVNPGAEADSLIVSADETVLRQQIASMAAQMARMEQLVANLGQADTVTLDPATENALATARDGQTGQEVGEGPGVTETINELPKPVPTDAKAKDAPRQAGVKIK